jgi:hypothetical protein
MCEFFTNSKEMLKLPKQLPWWRLLRKEKGYRLDAVGLKNLVAEKVSAFVENNPPHQTSITAGKVA